MPQSKWLIPAGEGIGFKVNKGQIIRVTDVEGEQVADFVAYRADDASERIDPNVTMDALHKMKVRPGDILYSNKYRPILTVVADDVGVHDFINASCRPEMYEFLYGKKNHASCHENLTRALEPYGLPEPDQHYAFNVFMNTVIHPDGSISVERPLSKAGDSVELRAEMDLVVAVSACPCSESACNGYACTPILVEVVDG
ncbi:MULTISPECIES: urea carboxylase-associated family protein [unclassified Paenibacillus]|uniref:DUF1989 domain-containing protein n=1 Tax=unclassified Paenibacillus TaxID=185978 RepID=UPI000955D5DF|nr:MULTISPECIES: urea carboxylase-associated family protein [unclassified Paenibacillus]ASS66910.1 urea carboxylase-associated family protein [Paenibacillus sp. RUD330]SIR52261.1 hypothetical protein SAMN05880555_4112 [Paenibacillus sp. RU4X]SIR61147.1 hypothetical protein SAMN05880570_4114 [Paenibacillus sp. RU4T]